MVEEIYEKVEKVYEKQPDGSLKETIYVKNKDIPNMVSEILELVYLLCEKNNVDTGDIKDKWKTK
jgi:hypothetical protein